MTVRMSPPPARSTYPDNRTRADRSIVAALHPAVTQLVGDAVRVRSVRHKPGRSLTVVYATSGSMSPPVLVTATIADKALSSPGITDVLTGLSPHDWSGRWPGIVAGPPGLSVQAFPADARLPALAEASDVSDASRIRAVLADAVTVLSGDTRRTVVDAEVDVVRYRGRTRCVLRYRVTTRSSAGAERRDILFGKIYRHASDASAVYDMAAALWTASSAPGPSYLPRPLTVVADMALVLSEAAGSPDPDALASGKAVLQPAAAEFGLAGVRSAGQALAWLHCATLDPTWRAARTTVSEASRVNAYLDLLAATGTSTDHAGVPVGEHLLSALAGAVCERPRLVHGAFRPNQLAFVGATHAAITDLDGAGAGDPAADVGDFCAHLRPPGMFSGRPDRRSWWGAARASFAGAYRDAMVRAGTAPDELDGTLRRAALFEASAFLRMAGHRARHMSSARPQESAAMVAEACRCVQRYQASPAAPEGLR